MATKRQVLSAIEKLGGQFNYAPNRFDEYEVVAPEGKSWNATLCSVLCYTDMWDTPKPEVWAEILEDVNAGLISTNEIED